MPLNDQEKKLLTRVMSYPLNNPEAPLSLLKRVARENQWTLAFAEKVTREYLLFCFLCVVSRQSLTPSDEVDQVWHLHILYARQYADFCENYLGQNLLHGPTLGGAAENQKFNDWYHYTLQLYQEKLDETPPPDVWPEAKIRFRNARFVRLDLETHWAIRKPRWARFLIYRWRVFPLVVRFRVRQFYNFVKIVFFRQ